jgi:hypothetical protein
MSRRRALGKKVSCAGASYEMTKRLAQPMNGALAELPSARPSEYHDVAGSPATAAILASPASLQIKAYSAVYLGMSDTGYPCGVARDPASTGHRIS